MTRSRTAAAFHALLIACFLVLGACGQHPESRTPIKLTIGSSPVTYSALLVVAKEKGFFTKNGIDAEIRKYESGLAAVTALAAGELDLATVADFAFASSVLDDPDLRVVASISTAGTTDVIGRLDKGVKTPADLRGKRIGVSRNTISEYYLSGFLLENSIRQNEATLVDIKPERIPDALAEGQVDAVSAWDMYAHACRLRLGEDRAVSWPAQGGQDYFWILATRQETIDAHADAFPPLIKALAEAESYIKSNPDAAKSIVARYWGYSPDLMDAIWPRSRYSVAMDQALLFALESGAKWRIEHSPNKARQVPNMLAFLYMGALDAVDSKRVTVFR